MQQGCTKRHSSPHANNVMPPCHTKIGTHKQAINGGLKGELTLILLLLTAPKWPADRITVLQDPRTTASSETLQTRSRLREHNSTWLGQPGGCIAVLNIKEHDRLPAFAGHCCTTYGVLWQHHLASSSTLVAHNCHNQQE